MEGRKEPKPSMVDIGTHLARGAPNGGATFHDRGGPYGNTKSTKRIVAVDVCGLPLAARVVPAPTSESTTVELLLEDMAVAGQPERLELVLVDRGTSQRSAAQLSARSGVEVRQLGWGTPQLEPQTWHCCHPGPASAPSGNLCAL